MQASATERAPAKLTLSLRITGVRADGYHLLEAEMVSLDLADTLTFSSGDGLDVVRLDAPGPAGHHPVPADEQNRVVKALLAAGRRAMVRLEKRIPPGAGLGGGSSDAAAVLRWAGVRDPAVAASIGSDVPFCLVGGRALVRGAGEVVEPLVVERRDFVLLVPSLAVSTAAVYRAWDELGGPTSEGPNDLEAAALALHPILARWRGLFGDLTGATPVLAGSGSSWFVDGSPRSLGLEDRGFLVLDGERAPLLAVSTAL